MRRAGARNPDRHQDAGRGILSLDGNPLGLTGEVAEAIAADVLGLELAPPRTAGYDAIRRTTDGSEERIQVKGRAFGPDANPGQRLGWIKQRPRATRCY